MAENNFLQSFAPNSSPFEYPIFFLLKIHAKLFLQYISFANFPAMNDIQKKSGADFDREYIKEMVDDHEKDVNKFKRFAEEDNVDADLKSFASKTLPVLLMHQDSAKKISDVLK